MLDLGNALRRTSRILAAPLVERGYRPDPVYLFLELNRKCNHRCVMCGIWKEQTNGLPQEEIERIFSAALFNKVERVILAGGEPMMRKDLVQIASFFVNRLKRLRALAFLTNGFNTTRTLEVANGVLDEIERGPREGRHLVMQISLDAIGDLYNEIRGVKHAWERTHETVRQLKDLSRARPNLGIMLHVVMLPQNLHQLDAIDEFAREFDLPILFSPAVISETYFSNSNEEYDLSFSTEQREFVKEFLSRRTERFTEAMPFYYNDVRNMLDGAPRSRRCMMGYHHIYVKMDGTVYPCINSSDHLLGDLRTQPATDVWRGSRSEKSRRAVRSDFCPTCPSACDNDIISVGELVSTLKLKHLKPR